MRKTILSVLLLLTSLSMLFAQNVKPRSFYNREDIYASYTYECFDPAETDAFSFGIKTINGISFKENNTIYTVLSAGITKPVKQKNLFAEIPQSMDFTAGLGYEHKFRSFRLSGDIDFMAKNFQPKTSPEIDIYSLIGMRADFSYDLSQRITASLTASAFSCESGWQMGAGISVSLRFNKTNKAQSTIFYHLRPQYTVNAPSYKHIGNYLCLSQIENTSIQKTKGCNTKLRFRSLLQPMYFVLHVNE